ncbi:hypothetical protein C8J57DRAFT_1223548 [Mycena rebaudengoi]|nr:hypothetical protein C8J57DRAFT_1223548 [Mycena rebaudengoi]
MSSIMNFARFRFLLRQEGHHSRGRRPAQLHGDELRDDGLCVAGAERLGEVDDLPHHKALCMHLGIGLPPVAATATAVDLTGDLQPRAVSRRPVESLKKFLTGRHGQRDGRDGSAGCGTCEVPTVSFSGFNCGASPKLSRIDTRNSDIRVRRLPKSQQIDWNLGIFRVRSERTETEAVKEVLLTAEMNDPLNGRDGRVSTGRRGRKPCRSRAVDLWRKWLTERARHPFDGCRRTVPTVTGGSPTWASERRVEQVGAGDHARLGWGLRHYDVGRYGDFVQRQYHRQEFLPGPALCVAKPVMTKAVAHGVYEERGTGMTTPWAWPPLPVRRVRTQSPGRFQTRTSEERLHIRLARFHTFIIMQTAVSLPPVDVRSDDGVGDVNFVPVGLCGCGELGLEGELGVLITIGAWLSIVFPAPMLRGIAVCREKGIQDIALEKK